MALLAQRLSNVLTPPLEVRDNNDEEDNDVNLEKTMMITRMIKRIGKMKSERMFFF